MPPRRLAVVYDGKGFAGAEVHLGLLCKYLDRDRYQPEVVVAGRLWPEFSMELARVLKESDTPLHVTPEKADAGPTERALWLPRTVRMLRGLRCELAYVGTSTPIGLRKDLLALRLAGMRLVRLLHLPASHVATFHEGPWSPRGVRALDKLVQIDLTVSAIDRRELIEHFGIPEKKIEVCYHGLELDRLSSHHSPPEARRALGLDPSIPTVGLIGRFSEQKGHRYLVEAARSIKDRVGSVQFILVGDGELKAEIRRLIKEQGLTSCFVFAGFQRDVRPWIEALDVAVMPSLYESAGLVLLECLAMERLVVASDLPCIREHVGTDTCPLVPPRDATALGERVIELLADPEGTMRQAKLGATLIRARFDIRRHVAQIMDVFDRVR